MSAESVSPKPGSPILVPRQNEDKVGFLDQHGNRNHIHPEEVQGRFVTLRRWLYFALIAFYLALPFIHIGEHPAVHLDLEGRRFFLFGQAYNAQDAWLLVFLLATLAFSLVFFTAWLGRVWCGYACPQTVFLEGVYRRIERFIEGNATQRQALAREGWTARHVALFAAKQLAFLAVSLVLAHWFLAFFVTVPDLTRIVLRGPAGNPGLFAWAMFFTGLLQFNFAWFREQLCFIVCPYGRFQSALIDTKSIIVGYDKTRGEPRGKPGKALPVVQAAEEPLGDCVDCGKCVRVCPTGIDIRNGLQLECIGCAQCIDACDSVMDKLGRPRGLVRYDSLLGLQGQKHGIVRPRLVAYGLVASLSLGTAGLQVFAVRKPFEANLLRPQGMPYVLDAGTVRNQFELHLINKHPGPADYTLEAKAPAGVQVLIAQPQVHLGTLESLRTPIFVIAERDDEVTFPFDFEVVVKDLKGGRTRTVSGHFLAPPGLKSAHDLPLGL